MHATRKSEKTIALAWVLEHPGAMRSHIAWFRELRGSGATHAQTMNFMKNVELLAKLPRGRLRGGTREGLM